MPQFFFEAINDFCSSVNLSYAVDFNEILVLELTAVPIDSAIVCNESSDKFGDCAKYSRPPSIKLSPNPFKKLLQ